MMASKTSKIYETINKKAGSNEAMQGISAAVNDSAEGVAAAATNTNELVGDITQITEQMEDNQKIAAGLKAEADRFVKL